MINLETEKSLTLSAQERYDIISMAMDAADDNGFINSFVFERALYVYAAIILYPENKDVISQAAAADLIRTWETLVENGVLEQMVNDYSTDIDYLSQESNKWYTEYSDYAHSARGILEMVQQFTGNITQSAAAQLTQTAQETGVGDLLEIANNWGMNRDALKDVPEKDNIVHAESLFKD